MKRLGLFTFDLGAHKRCYTEPISNTRLYLSYLPYITLSSPTSVAGESLCARRMPKDAQELRGILQERKYEILMRSVTGNGGFREAVSVLCQCYQTYVKPFTRFPSFCLLSFYPYFCLLSFLLECVVEYDMSSLVFLSSIFYLSVFGLSYFYV